ncbi:MAG: hypothetical protein J1F03_03730 [Oscillospiraceae bacterium]|nr:hypothetical protein [Oscillospiraceae bacterium]
MSCALSISTVFSSNAPFFALGLKMQSHKSLAVSHSSFSPFSAYLSSRAAAQISVRRAPLKIEVEAEIEASYRSRSAEESCL